jgi:hypothetical protein
MSEAATTQSNIDKFHDTLAGKGAPAVIGKPVFAKDMEMLKACGVHDMKTFLGARESNDSAPAVRSINFGLKSEAGNLPDEVRLRLFGLKKLFNAVEIQAQIMTRSAYPSADAMMATPIYKQHLEPMLKAFDISGFSSWSPTVNARFYFQELDVPLLVAGLFDSLPMEAATITVPGALGRLKGKLETDTATFSGQSNTQASYQVVAKNNVCHAEITEDLTMDSVPAIIDKLRYEVVAGVARSEEHALLEGDDSLVHMDADVTAATDFRKAYKGLRKLALANSANGVAYDHAADVPTKALFEQLLKRMGKFASEKGDLAYILPPTVSNALVTGAIPELFTAFAFGGPASNVTGQVPPVFGIKCVESEWIREDLFTSGVYTVPGQTKTYALLVKKSRFASYVRAGIRVWAAPSLPSSDKMLMSAKKRHAFAGNPQSATEKSVAIGYNVETIS